MHDQSLEQFRFRVDQLCRWAEIRPSDPNADVERTSRILAGLIYSGAKLKDDGCRVFQSELPPAQDQAKVLDRFRLLPPECAPVQSVTRFCPARRRTRGLAYCLADIHHELSAGLRLHKEGRKAAARSLWRFGYLHSWGKLAICALFVLHSSMEETNSYDIDRLPQVDPAQSVS